MVVARTYQFLITSSFKTLHKSYFRCRFFPLKHRQQVLLQTLHGLLPQWLMISDLLSSVLQTDGVTRQLEPMPIRAYLVQIIISSLIEIQLMAITITVCPL